MRRGILSGKHQGVLSSTLEKLAPVLETTSQWLLTGEGNDIAKSAHPEEDEVAGPPMIDIAGLPSNVEFADVDLLPRAAFVRDVPVYGTAMGSIVKRVEGFQMEPEIVDHVRRPPALNGVKGAYSLIVTGQSMFPLHKDRDLCFVNPHQRPMIDDSVIVFTKHHENDPGQAYIKILKKRTLSSVVVEQLNPPAILEIPLKYVVSVHRVLTMSDLFSI